MKWQGWLSVALLGLFVVTLFLPRLEISGERYVDMAEEVNEHIQDVEKKDGGEAVSSGAVSAAAVVTDGFESDETRKARIDTYDDRIDEELESRAMNSLFFGKWALTVDDTLYFEGTEFEEEKKIEDSGVQSMFKVMGVLVYVPVLLAVVVLVLCIVQKGANGIFLISLGCVAGGVELVWRLVLPGMIWSKTEEYIHGFTDISNEVLHSDGMGSYTISGMISHFTSWGPAVSIVFAVLFIGLGILLLTIWRQREMAFDSAMPEFAAGGSFGGAAVPPVSGYDSASVAEPDQPTMAMANYAVASGGLIHCVAGQFQRSTFDVGADEEFIIGRDPKSCHLVLEYPKISRRHCGIKFDPDTGNYLVIDYSSNGTRLSTGGMVSNTYFQPVLPGTTLYLAIEKEAFLLE